MVGLSDSASIDELQRKVTESFEGRFKLTKGVHAVRWEAHFPCLDRSKADSLKASFSKNEIWRELMGMDRNKAHGLDGFMVRFF